MTMLGEGLRGKNLYQVKTLKDGMTWGRGPNPLRGEVQERAELKEEIKRAAPSKSQAGPAKTGKKREKIEGAGADTSDLGREPSRRAGGSGISKKREGGDEEERGWERVRAKKGKERPEKGAGRPRTGAGKRTLSRRAKDKTRKKNPENKKT